MVLHWNPARDFYAAVGSVPMDEWIVYRMSGAGIIARGDRSKSRHVMGRLTCPESVVGAGQLDPVAERHHAVKIAPHGPVAHRHAL
jgi:hypothetical protein